MSYLNKIEQLFNQTQKWDYYRCHYQHTLREIFEHPESFINETFVSGHKHKLTDRNAQTPNISDARAAHSVSAYFMGFIFADGLFHKMLDNFCEIDGDEFSFSYVWYLTSLYHDYGYCFERDAELTNRLYEQITGKNKIYGNNYFNGVLYHLRKDREVSIRYSPWSGKKPYSIYQKQGRIGLCPKETIEEYISKNHRNLVCNSQYICMPMRSSRVVDNYLKYRLIGNGDHRRIDHGICGGMIFYDRIIKNYINEYEHEKRRNPNLEIHEFYQNNHIRNLRFKLSQLVIFMYVADCIINHNIWKANDKTEEIYKQYKLRSLIGDKFEKISFYKNPLLFVLVMSDTLEPYKNFYSACHHGDNIDCVNYNVSDVFAAYEKYDIVFENNGINIYVSDDLQEVCESKLKEMTDWIDIKYTRKNDSFVIEIY